MGNKKIRISEAEYDAVCEYRKSLGKSFVPKELFKRGKGKSYRTRLCDEEFKIVNNIEAEMYREKKFMLIRLFRKEKMKLTYNHIKTLLRS